MDHLWLRRRDVTDSMHFHQITTLFFFFFFYKWHKINKMCMKWKESINPRSLWCFHDLLSALAYSTAPKTVLFVCREINRADILGRYDCLGSGLNLCVCLVMTGIGLGACVCVCFGGLCSLFRQNSSSSFCLSISLFRLTAWRGRKTIYAWKWTKAKWISSRHFHWKQ